MVKIRLMKIGSKKRPFYRIVVADVRAPRDGSFLEIVGYYDPRPDPHVLEVKSERVEEWLRHGAQPTDRVNRLLNKAGINV